MQYSPVNLYSSMKQAFEDIAKFYFESGKINFSTIKLPDTYGPNDTRPKLLNLLIKSINKKAEILINVNKKQKINLIHVDDVVNAFHLVMSNLHYSENKNGEIFTLFSKEKVTIHRLINIIEELCGTSLNISWKESESFFIAKPPKLNSVRNWEPKISLREGIKNIINKKSKI